MFLAVLVIVLVVVVLVVAAIAAFAVRRRLVQRPGGTFDCSLRAQPHGSPAPPAASSGNFSPGGAAGSSGGVPSAAPTGSAESSAAAGPTESAGPLPGDDDPSALEPRPDVADHGKGWVFGIARYSGDRIEWFRVFSYSPRPRWVLERAGIEVVERRVPLGQEELALLTGAVVLVCRHRGEPIELAMSEDALTGFLAWLEAAPPGQRVNVA